MSATRRGAARLPEARRCAEPRGGRRRFVAAAIDERDLNLNVTETGEMPYRERLHEETRCRAAAARRKRGGSQRNERGNVRVLQAGTCV
jgi:hypothetical protein